MPAYTWPFPLDDADALIGVVGSFWDDTYGSHDFTANALHAKAQSQFQAHLDLLGLTDCLSRFKVPVLATEAWYPLTLVESELNDPNLPLWDGTYNFDSGLYYDTPVASPLFAFPAPAELTDANVVLNRITNATTAYARGLDFFLRPSSVWFRVNPFDDPDAAVEDVFEGGVVVDRRVTLWVYNGLLDKDAVYEQYGYVLDLHLRSTARYRSLVNAVYDGMVEGTTVRCIEDFLSAAVDVPLAAGDETVQYVLEDSRYLWVVTDKTAYRFNPAATPVVAAGDAVRAGDPLTDGLRFYECNRGQVPDEVRALAVGRGLLAAGYFRELIFQNGTAQLVVTTADGYTKVTFETGGWPGDVEKFWDDVHAAGVARDDTLAMRLDSRENKTGQPTALNLPVTVNPLGFLLEHVFRGTLVMVRVKPECFGPEALGLHVGRLLRKLVNPQVALVLVVEMTRTETVVMDGPGTETGAGVEEDVTVYLGQTYTETIDPDDYVAETVRVFQIDGYCR